MLHNPAEHDLPPIPPPRRRKAKPVYSRASSETLTESFPDPLPNGAAEIVSCTKVIYQFILRIQPIFGLSDWFTDVVKWKYPFRSLLMVCVWIAVCKISQPREVLINPFIGAYPLLFLVLPQILFLLACLYKFWNPEWSPSLPDRSPDRTPTIEVMEKLISGHDSLTDYFDSLREREKTKSLIRYLGITLVVTTWLPKRFLVFCSGLWLLLHRTRGFKYIAERASGANLNIFKRLMKRNVKRQVTIEIFENQRWWAGKSFS